MVRLVKKIQFQVQKNKLISSDYLKFRYKYGMIVVDEDLQDLIANDQPKSDENNMELVINKSFIGSENKNIMKNSMSISKEYLKES